jgi:hypothetical protein
MHFCGNSLLSTLVELVVPGPRNASKADRASLASHRRWRETIVGFGALDRGDDPGDIVRDCSGWQVSVRVLLERVARRPPSWQTSSSAVRLVVRYKRVRRKLSRSQRARGALPQSSTTSSSSRSNRRNDTANGGSGSARRNAAPSRTSTPMRVRPATCSSMPPCALTPDARASAAFDHRRSGAPNSASKASRRGREPKSQSRSDNTFRPRAM